MFTLPTIPHPITLHHLSSDKSENRFGLMQQICTPLSKLIFSDMSRKEQILRPKTDSVSIQRTQNQHAWGNVELISATSYIETPLHTLYPISITSDVVTEPSWSGFPLYFTLSDYMLTHHHSNYIRISISTTHQYLTRYSLHNYTLHHYTLYHTNTTPPHQYHTSTTIAPYQYHSPHQYHISTTLVQHKYHSTTTPVPH